MFKKKSKLIAQSPVSLVTLKDPKSSVSEMFRTIRSNIRFSMVDEPLKTMVVTSSGPSEGKSTVASNLAVVFADSKIKTLLIDADLRRPTVAMTWHVSNVQGLSNLLGGHGQPLAFCQETAVANLSIMPSGVLPPNPAELLDSRRMTEVLESLKAHFDMIIIDTPPLVAATDAQVLSAKVDGVVLVTRERKTSKGNLVRAKELLETANAKILGVVYNGANSVIENYYYYGGKAND
ncbi:MAG: CpsD/CapB family tyrosine-protein kinase [Streptococcaceae bacterium]|jgi:capsular exopolysaccharide synthesis family protein|nr:CpsD/CapB family tyrosine-protein kinase [Streptococcaceae bacterium]